MKTLRRLQWTSPAFFKVVAACVLVPWVIALAMAASPQLHEHLHEDAHHADHECVVTHMLAGDFGDAVPLVIVAVVPPVPVADIAVVDDCGAWVSPLYLANGVLEHAPPGLV